MNYLIISIIIGISAAIIDTVPMIIKKLDIMFILSAFSMWVITAYLTCHFSIVQWPVLNGLFFAVLIFIPLSFLIYSVDRNAMIQVVLSTVVLGCLVGYSSGVLIK